MSAAQSAPPPPPHGTPCDSALQQPPPPPGPGEMSRQEAEGLAVGIHKRKRPGSPLGSVKSSRSSVVVPHPHPSKRIPSKVLQEEDYTEAVGVLIERDFFPDLKHLRLRQEMILARKAGDDEKLDSLIWELANLPRATPAGTPAAMPTTPMERTCKAQHRDHGGQTPLSAWERDEDAQSSVADASDLGCSRHTRLKLGDGREVLVDLSRIRLDDFQKLFTSEDNASFEAIIRSDRDKALWKEAWVEKWEKSHNTDMRTHHRALAAGGAVAHQEIMSNDFKARNSLYFNPEGLRQAELEKPKCDFSNTRFTIRQHKEIEGSLENAVACRNLRVEGEMTAAAYETMASEGRIGVLTKQGPRAVGGRLQSPGLPHAPAQHGGGGFSLVKTPTLLPGVDGLSPLMTFGTIASTPVQLEEHGPSFRIVEDNEREEAAERLQRGAAHRQRQTKQVTRAERLRALGLTPNGQCPAGTQAPGARSSQRVTPASISKVTPLSPIGQLLHRAQKLAQKGGRLRIGSGRHPTPMITPRSGSACSAPKSRSRTPLGVALEASITDDLL